MANKLYRSRGSSEVGDGFWLWWCRCGTGYISKGLRLHVINHHLARCHNFIIRVLPHSRLRLSSSDLAYLTSLCFA